MAETAKAKSVKKADIPEGLAKQDKPAVVEDDSSVKESYVWLANGDVLRVANEDLPQAGHQTLGHWQRGDKVFLVVGVYPVEDKGMVDDE